MFVAGLHSRRPVQLPMVFIVRRNFRPLLICSLVRTWLFVHMFYYLIVTNAIIMIFYAKFMLLTAEFQKFLFNLLYTVWPACGTFVLS